MNSYHTLERSLSIGYHHPRPLSVPFLFRASGNLVYITLEQFVIQTISIQYWFNMWEWTLITNPSISHFCWWWTLVQRYRLAQSIHLNHNFADDTDWRNAITAPPPPPSFLVCNIIFVLLSWPLWMCHWWTEVSTHAQQQTKLARWAKPNQTKPSNLDQMKSN